MIGKILMMAIAIIGVITGISLGVLVGDATGSIFLFCVTMVITEMFALSIDIALVLKFNI